MWSLLFLLATALFSSSTSYPRAAGSAALFFSPPGQLLERARRMLRAVPSAVEEAAVVGDLKKIIENGPIPASERCFIVNGWRWHTSAVIRDLERFKGVVSTEMQQGVSSSSSNNNSNSNSKSAERIMGSYNFVFGFSWKALMRIEREIFFPWLERLLPESAVNLLSDIVQQHTVINVLSEKMLQQCTLLLKTKDEMNSDAHIASYKRIDDLIGQLQACALRIQSVQESVFVPYISAFVSRKEQEVFNRQVISRLGIVDSQVHLVSMFDAVRNQPKELRMYEAQIPRMLRALTPTIRKRLYLPRGARFLDCVSD